MRAIIFLFFIYVNIYSQDSIPTTVDTVDLQRYQGTWYEISKIPNSFQDHCIKNTTANYRLSDDGEIIVLNRCLDEDSEIDEAEGVARIVENSGNAKLEVSFVSIFGWNIFWGDYWVLGLDGEYRYAVIGTPSRKYGWILSRTPKMTDEDLEECYKIFEKNGYNRNSFELSLQER